MVERQVNHLAEHGCGTERPKQTDHPLNPAFEAPQIGVGENEAQSTWGKRRIVVNNLGRQIADFIERCFQGFVVINILTNLLNASSSPHRL
jgi:hypothetical protein